MSNLKVRFVEPVGTVYRFSIYHKEPVNDHYHRHEYPITEAEFNDFDGMKAMYAGKETTCDCCGQVFTPDSYSAGSRTLWNSGSDKLEPGDMYWVTYLHDAEGKCIHPGWEDCDPKGHLHVTLPNGNPWDIDGRASNCTMKEDKTHRCWVRHGEPPDIHVDKNGHTCAAGAGSILSGDYHGFLHNGELVSC